MSSWKASRATSFSRPDRSWTFPPPITTLAACARRHGRDGGLIALRGQLLGSASGEYDAGGTYVPFENGGIQLNGQSIEDFGGLNRRLTQTGVTGSRSFQTRIGDLTVGDEVRARHVVIAADGGSLRINGKIDASGRWAASGSRP